MKPALRLGLAALLSLGLAACASLPPPRTSAPMPAPAQPAPAASSSTHSASATIQPIPAPAPQSLWQRIRTHLVLPGCDADPRIVPTARWLIGDPQTFEQTLSAARPMISLVQQAVEAAGIPSDFTLLPMVESGYRPDAVGPGNFIGMWQFDRGTARGAGMPLLPGYDGRRDPWVSSVRATRMLARYGHELDDWRLVVWAYNQGEWGIKRLLHQRGDPPARPVIPDWPVGRGARDYLLRLLAYGCIVRDPGRFDITLPPAVPPADLTLVHLRAPLPLPLAAQLAGLPDSQLRVLNAGYLQARMPADAPWHLLLPRAARARFLDRYALLQPAQWGDLVRYRLRLSTTLDALLPARARGDAPARSALAEVNRVPVSNVLRVGHTLWLPRHLQGPALLRIGGSSGVPVWYRVQPGDSLWSLARRFHLSIAELRAWNNLRGEELRIGQRLRLSAPG